MKKTEFLYVQPKTEKSKEIFEELMYKLHTCRVLNRINGYVHLKSISDNYYFYVKETNDPHWNFIK